MIGQKMGRTVLVILVSGEMFKDVTWPGVAGGELNSLDHCLAMLRIQLQMTQALGDDIDQAAELATNWDVHLKYLGQCYVTIFDM